MKMTLLFLMLALRAALSASATPDYYVTVNGNDSWTGRLARPDRQKTDGPFLTLHRAQQAVRDLKAREPGRAIPIVVRICAGVHLFATPVEFTPEDSGSDKAPVIYEGEAGKTVLSGGIPLTGWLTDAKGRWTLDVPQTEVGGWNFAQLWVNGERRYRPRLPKSGYYTFAGDGSATLENAGKGFDRVKTNPGEVRADWQNLGDVELLGFQIWSMARLRVKSVEADGTVTLTGPTVGREPYQALPKGNRFLIENVQEALTEPGEWYVDRPRGRLTYIPKPGETPNIARVFAPRLERLVEFRGDVAGQKWVRHLTFRNLTFAHANWVTPPQGNSSYQAESNVGAAIEATGLCDSRFENCTVAHVGGYALSLGAGCRHNTVTGCAFTDMGAGGILLGTTNVPTDPEALASHNTVENCLIAHGGRMHPAGIGVWIGHSPHNTVTHNEIADFYYTGVSVGWSWGYEPSEAHHNTVAYNSIHDIGQGVLSDMGGIYTLGAGKGPEGTASVLHHNLIHDVDAFGYGGWGIYFDEGTTKMTARDNVVYRTKDAGFHQHYGRDNLVENNVFALGRDSQVKRTRAEPHLSFTFRRNVVIWRESGLLGSDWQGDTSNYLLDSNLYWNTAGKPIDFAGMTLEQWRAKGQDTHSRLADPLFVSLEANDFRLKSNSPAFALGFQPIDMSGFGPKGKRKPVTPVRAFPPPAR